MMQASASAWTRLDALHAGPWLDDGAPALAELRPPSPLGRRFAESRVPIDLSLFDRPVDERRLKRLFRSLELDRDQPGEDALFEVRASMDQALAFLQLEELAVATGYLTADEVYTDARRRLYDILWSRPAREYVRTCGFVGVRMLAERVGVSLGLPALQPSKPVHNGAIRFAGMLSELETWFEEGPLDIWLDILDDFATSEVDEAAVEKALTSKRRQSPDPAVSVALIGADMFVNRLANLFGALPDDEVPLYGTHFSYWLAKFFGQEFHQGDFRKAAQRPDWSVLLPNNLVLNDRRRQDLAEEIWGLRAAWQISAARIKSLTASDALDGKLQLDGDHPRPASTANLATALRKSAANETEFERPSDSQADSADLSVPRQGWWTRSFGA